MPKINQRHGFLGCLHIRFTVSSLAGSFWTILKSSLQNKYRNHSSAVWLQTSLLSFGYGPRARPKPFFFQQYHHNCRILLSLRCTHIPHTLKEGSIVLVSLGFISSVIFILFIELKMGFFWW